MIAGIGVDVVDLARFERSIARTPKLRDRLFTEAERLLPVHSLAARFAAKEALIKALGGGEGVRWHDMEIVPDEERNPGFVLHNVVEAQVRERGIVRMLVKDADGDQADWQKTVDFGPGTPAAQTAEANLKQLAAPPPAPAAAPQPAATPPAAPAQPAPEPPPAEPINPQLPLVPQP